MRNIISSSIAALALSFAVTGTAVASPNTEGGDAYATKILMSTGTDNVIRGVEGAPNDGQMSPLGFIVTNNVVHQTAATSELPSPDAE